MTALVLFALSSVAITRTLLVRDRQHAPPPALPVELEPLALARRLAGALAIPTISSPEPDARELAAIEDMVRYLARTFARTHEALVVERPSSDALLYTFAGSDPALAPALLLAHLDVVAVDAATLDEWAHPPFSGELAFGFLHGRGALDDKSSAIAILEAVDHLLRAGQRPRRTLLLALGFDEEQGGARGADVVAKLLRERGVRPEFVLDEGGFVLEGFVDGVRRPIAAVGVAEKGTLEIELTATAPGGHASLAHGLGAIGRMSRALARIEGSPMRATLDEPARSFLERLLPDLPFARRLVLANTWVSERLVLRSLERNAGTNALIRTTAVATRIEGGGAPNALPAAVRALVNFRLHPRDTPERVLERARALVGDAGVELRIVESVPPSPLSPAEGPGWELLERTILQVFPDARVAPALCVALTDARHFTGLTPHVYRFLPLRLSPEEAPRIHGAGERIALASYLEMVRFYVQLLGNL